MRISTKDRFWQKVQIPQVDGGCWNWLGNRMPNGYGRFNFKDTWALAHRYAYKLLSGPIPEGKCLDHLCRNRACVNPEHLEIVTARENILRGESYPAQHARKTHCKYGHPFSGNNLYLYPGRRQCRECNAARAEKWRRKNGIPPRWVN